MKGKVLRSISFVLCLTLLCFPLTAFSNEEGDTPKIEEQEDVQANLESEPMIQLEVESAVQPEPEPAAQPEPEPAVQPEPEPVAQAESEPVVQPEPEPVAQAEPQPVAQPQSGPAVQTEPELVVQPESKPAVQPESEAEVQQEPKPQPEVELESEPDQSLNPDPQVFTITVKFVCGENQIREKKVFNIEEGKSFSYDGSLSIEGYRAVEVKWENHYSTTVDLVNFIRVSDVSSNEVFKVIYERNSLEPQPEPELEQEEPESEASKQEEPEQEEPEQEESKQEESEQKEPEQENYEDEDENLILQSFLVVDEEDEELEYFEDIIEEDGEFAAEEFEDSGEVLEEDDNLEEEELEEPDEEEYDIVYAVSYRYKEGTHVPEDCNILPVTFLYSDLSEINLLEVSSQLEPWYNFSGWVIAANAEHGELNASFENYEKYGPNIVLEGYFTQAEYYFDLVNSYSQDAVFNSGAVKWNAIHSCYELDATQSVWKVEPMITCTVSNKGSKPVKVVLTNTGENEILFSDETSHVVEANSVATLTFKLGNGLSVDSQKLSSLVATMQFQTGWNCSFEIVVSAYEQ